MKIIKFSGYLVDQFGMYRTGGIKEAIENAFGTWYGETRHVHEESVKVTDIETFRALKKANCDLSMCERNFAASPSMDNGRTVKPGERYQHFKTGKIVTVLAVAQNTEAPGAYAVVYSHTDEEGTTRYWHRPLEMFTSPVDRNKYPDASQFWRFELYEDGEDSMNAAMQEVEKAVALELDAANEKFPLFGSAHEGYAVILEEADETRENMEMMYAEIDRLWMAVRKNDTEDFDLSRMLKACEETAAEAIQAAAMVKKFAQSRNENWPGAAQEEIGHE